MSVPASSLIEKYKDFGKKLSFSSILKLKILENIDRFNRNGQFGLMDDISLSFLHDGDDLRIPAWGVQNFNGNARPNLLYSYTETDDQKKLRKEKIKNVTVVSKSGKVFKGFKGRLMSYEQTQKLCLSRGARIPWFEMFPNQFSGPVWIE